MSDNPKNLIRTSQLSAADGLPIKHPHNPNSKLTLWPLGDRAGMKRVMMNMARIPPGKEAFVPHTHSVQEEFVFVLEGQGTALIGEDEISIGPGDYIGYPTDSPAHHLINSGTEDLLVLMGGERTDVEVSQFPTLGKVGVFRPEGIQFFDADSAEITGQEPWLDTHIEDENG